MSSSSSGCQFVDKENSSDLSANSVLPAVPLRYMLVPDRYCSIRKRNIMTWPAALSTFVLNRMCELIKNGVPMDKGFRLRELQAVAEAVLKFCGREVDPLRIYNHLRHWRARWVHVLKLKRLDDVRWVKETLATRYLAMSPESRMSWFTSFLRKYYL